MAVSETRTLPPEFIEALGKTYAADLTRQAGIPSITTATTQQPGETADPPAGSNLHACSGQCFQAERTVPPPGLILLNPIKQGQPRLPLFLCLIEN